MFIDICTSASSAKGPCELVKPYVCITRKQGHPVAISVILISAH